MKKTNNARVCVIMATYNGGKYLREQIDSIINQTYKNVTIYVSDDNSTDDTISVLNSYKKKLGAERLMFVNNKTNKHGAVHNFAYAYKTAPEADYYMFADQDDYWERTKIEEMLNVAEKEDESKPLLVYCDCKVVDKDLKVINESFVRSEKLMLSDGNKMKQLLLKNYIPGCVMMFNSALRQVSPEIWTKCPIHDWWIALVAERMGKIVFYDKALNLYRQHDNNTLGAADTNNDTAIKKRPHLSKIFSYKTAFASWRANSNEIRDQIEGLRNMFGDSGRNGRVVKDLSDALSKKTYMSRLRALRKGRFYPYVKWTIIKLAY